MEISKAEDNGNVIKEAISSVSRSSSEFEKDIGSAHVIQKSSSLEAEESSRMVSQSPLDQKIVETANESKEAAEHGEIIQQDLKSTLKDIITEIEEALPENEESTETEQNDDTENSDCLPEIRGHQIDRQTSTTSLEDFQKRPRSSADGIMRESNAAAFLSLLGRGDVGKRPHSLPANLAHLWQSLKIANELNQSLQESSVNGGEGEVLDSVAFFVTSGSYNNFNNTLH